MVIALFSTGLKVERRLNWREWSTVTRLLAIGMPAFIALATLFGTTVMGLSAGAAIVLAGALAPTDPVLAGDIGVGPPGEEGEEHEPHFGVSAEAGFNDGLAFPFVLLGIAIAAGDDPVSLVRGRRRLRDRRGDDRRRGDGLRDRGADRAPARPRPADRSAGRLGRRGGDARDLRGRRDAVGLRLPGGVRGRAGLPPLRARPRAQRAACTTEPRSSRSSASSR